MRPIKLTISAFGPFASKQVIDFEELKGRNIFVISGKTGAGKTTIFDAISYALYGEASGDSRQTDSLRSHFADDDTETYVELEFELRGERYIVNRIPKQKKKKARGEGYTEKNADATLILPNEKVITKVNNVNAKMIELLGITREQFKQIVMLAQGEFKKLLLADSVERENIFRKIFNTYDFQEIQNELKKRADNLNNNRTKSKEEMNVNLKNLKGTHDIIIDEYIDYVVVIEKLKDLLKRDNNDYEQLNNEHRLIEKSLHDANERKITINNNNTSLKEKETLKENLDLLLSKKDEYKDKEESITSIKNAKEVKPIEDKILECNNKLIKKEEEYSISLKNINKLDIKQQEVSKLLQIEKDNEPYRDNLIKEINNLNRLESKIIELDNLNLSIKELNSNLETNKKEINSNKKEIENLEKTKEDKEKQLKEISSLETKKVELERDIDEEHKTIEKISELLRDIKSYNDTSEKHRNKHCEYEKINKEYNQKKEYYDSMDDAYKREQAGILAMSLEENKPCPVCGSKNHPNKAIIKDNFTILTKEELKSLKEDLDKVGLKKQEKLNELTSLNSQRVSNQEQINNNLNILSKTLSIDNIFDLKTEQTLKDMYNELNIKLDKLEKELSKITKMISLKDKTEEEIIDIENTIKVKEKSLNEMQDKQTSYSIELAQKMTKLEEYKKEIPQNIDTIDTLNKSIKDKTNELNISKEKLNKLNLESEEVSKRLEGEKSKSEEINKTINDLKLEINTVQSNFDEAIKKHQFTSIESYNKSKIEIPLLDSLEKDVKDYNSQFNIIKSKYEDAVNKTKDMIFTDIKDLEEEIKTIQNNKNELDSRLKDLYSIIENNRTILKNVEKLYAESKNIEDEYKIVGELADLANGKKAPYISFERYILASYFEDIIEAANLRLEKMTGDRFSLIRKTTKSKGAGQKGLELEIYDNYTDSSRDVSSLSGGESFKASLSLALGLSDIVQANAGGVSLDTMFVDEGFGTLDPQSLDNAIDSLLELQRGGRLVGIISHVEELKERIDAKLEVVSTPKGSKAEFNIL